MAFVVAASTQAILTARVCLLSTKSQRSVASTAPLPVIEPISSYQADFLFEEIPTVLHAVMSPAALIALLLPSVLRGQADFFEPVCQVRPPQCQLLCPHGYLRDSGKTCICACAIDPLSGASRPECPRLTGGVCALRCEGDHDCKGRLVCCSNGCGRECVTPLTQSFAIKAEKPIQPVIGSFHRLLNAVTQFAGSKLATMTPVSGGNPSHFGPTAIEPVGRTVKIGACPPPTGDGACKEQSKCSNDFDCPNFDKCCVNECGATCAAPIKSTSCVHLAIAVMRLPTSKLLNDFVPACEPNGRFSSVQCDSRWCWCVDVHYGAEIAGSRVEKAQRKREMCTENRLCAQKCSNECSHGHVMDVFGCPHVSCACVDICARVRCDSPSYTCQLIEPDCANPPCLPVPRCLLNPCESGSPLVLPNGITALCSANKDCGADFGCFKIGYNGLGFCCRGEHATKDGRCPSKSVKKVAATCFSSCKNDQDCPQELKCCFDGCALACVAPEFFSLKKANLLKTSAVAHYQPGVVERYNKNHLSSLVADCADAVAENGTCSSQCQADSDCHGMKRYVAGTDAPLLANIPYEALVSLTSPFFQSCFHAALTAELYALRLLKKCDRAGNFEQFQASLKHVQTRIEISVRLRRLFLRGHRHWRGSERFAGLDWKTQLQRFTFLPEFSPQEAVSAPSTCKPLVCPTNCPFGFEKDQSHCPTCRCRNPCEEVKCPQGSVCTMSKVLCYQRDNCPFQPRCLLNFCPSGDPHVSNIGLVESCNEESDCPSATHWCHQIGAPAGGVCCPIPRRSRNFGSCAVVPISLNSDKMCRVNCRVDDDCHMHQKCCFDGCGASCQDVQQPPISELTEDIEKKWSLYFFVESPLTSVKIDSDCSGVQKCCDDGCKKTCAYPMQTSKCMMRKTNLQKLGQLDVIKCHPDGSFEEIQCDNEFCWCVDDEGNYIEGTKSSDDVTPTCPEPCKKLSCPDLKCVYGRRKENDCETCDCLDPCENISCPDDSICVPTSVSCIKEPCPTVPRCVINPCPNSDVLLNITSRTPLRCKHRKQCANGLMSTHCAMLTADSGFAVRAKPRLHPGSCPNAELSLGEKCTRECSSDNDCENSSKCCWNGCGLGCVPASFDAAPVQLHLGECLVIPHLRNHCLHRPTVEECKKDEDCPSLLKCCFDGCVKRCSHPHKTTNCVHQRLSALQIAETNEETFVVECGAGGEFDEIQTHFGLMWCVDERGFEIPGNEIDSSARLPETASVSSEDLFQEVSLWSDNEGCSVCDCVKPCEFVACPAGTLCRLVSVACFEKDCQPVARCVPNMCSTGEPLKINDEELATCTSKSPCPAGFHCKNSGYLGLSICCPVYDLQLTQCAALPLTLTSVDAAPCVVGCRQPNDCPKSTCCFNGCGTSCQYESQESPAVRGFPQKPVVHTFSKKFPFSQIKPIKSISVAQPTPPRPQISLVATTSTPVGVTVINPIGILSAVQKLGTCKKVLLNPGCGEQCVMDADCPGYWKCCRATCGNVCSPPEIATACIHRLLAFNEKLAAENSNLPAPVQCSADGLFREHQCDINSKQCWCVNTLDGTEIPGTRIYNHVSLPDCSAPKICSTRCDSSKCPFGVRLDTNGCPMNGACECANLCSTFDCPVAMECVLMPVRCTTHPCPDVPQCIESLCATPQRDSYRNAVGCTADGGCGRGAKCVTSPLRAESGICCLQKLPALPSVEVPIPSTVLPTVALPPSITNSLPFPNKMTVIEATPISVMKATNCTTMQSALVLLKKNGAIVRGYTPLCDVSTGDYNTTQCDGSKCWCVNALNGEEIFGTRSSSRNPCNARTTCVSKCSGSMCPYGLVLDRNGCPRAECLCKSPCEDVDCVTGEVCILRRADCPSRWCLPVPNCERSPCNSGLRPLVESRTRQQFSCTDNSICPAGYYCTAYDENMHGVCCPARGFVGKKEQLCPHGDPFAASSDGTPTACTALSNGCPPTHYCSTRASQTTGVCCVSKRHVCNQQPDRGPCHGVVPRFFYSSRNHSCSIFEYGGCAGNLNNFATSADCDNFCAGVGLDLSSPYNEHEASSPIESYLLGFSLTGARIERSRRKDAERELETILAERFGIPRGSIEDLIIRDDNTVRFTIRDVDAQKFAREVSEQISSGKLALRLAGHHLKAEAHTLVAHHIAQETASELTARVVFYAILFAAFVFALLVGFLLCLACFCFYRNGSKRSNAGTTPSNTIAGSIVAERMPPRPIRRVERIFSRENVSVCSNRLADERPVSRNYY
ncbi:unnamed protein product [Caenorhabditis auriculariae]|uniref:Thyroglobulin type-1 domain-containing protein n=1 Tax=Caenorhabditis auriculariae TaxID=2777116 RepID=A0A8S1HEJ3_9PELO|nr:unnamed protein product [Caenorhabditis auriculariae]